eukprot:2815225-Rhodomonas_salina.1
MAAYGMTPSTVGVAPLKSTHPGARVCARPSLSLHHTPLLTLPALSLPLRRFTQPQPHALTASSVPHTPYLPAQ